MNEAMGRRGIGWDRWDRWLSLPTSVLSLFPHLQGQRERVPVVGREWGGGAVGEKGGDQQFLPSGARLLCPEHNSTYLESLLLGKFVNKARNLRISKSWLAVRTNGRLSPWGPSFSFWMFYCIW